MVENAGHASTPPWGTDCFAFQHLQATEGEWLFWLLAEQQRATLDQVMANQNTANQQMWGRVAQFLTSQALKVGQTRAAVAKPGPNPGMRSQKMMTDNNLVAFSNSFERTAIVAGCPTMQWSAILIPCLIGPT